ncbi:MAG TPA: LptF/LptG family permease [Lacibacter sp.]|nr:LptF/LptG family permease [Lacibacter sp.]HMO87706.1 LptF/LptG family permease [Lacibacter sp.]HMP87557.1 LptF/LptG family permease [Lacibacter sp.]
MKRIDAYILKTFLKTFFFSLFLFALIAVAIDASEKAEDFIRSGLSTPEVIRQYYYGFVPHIISLLFPVFVLISVVFFTSRLALRSEFVAMLSTGMSLRRILVPYWMGGVILALILGLSNHFVIPRANKIRTDFEHRYIDMGNMQTGSYRYINNLHLRIDSFTYAGMRSYDTSAQSGTGFFLERVQGNQMVYNLRSETIAWDTATSDWRLDNAIERRINGLQEEVNMLGTYHVRLGYRPVDINTDEYKKDKLGTRSLNRLIRQEKRRGSEGVNALQFERYRRDAYAVSVIVMTLIAGILASRKIRGGSGFHLALAFVIGVGFIVIDKFSMVFSVKGNFPPLIAAWLPTFLFGLLAWGLYQRSPR